MTVDDFWGDEQSRPLAKIDRVKRIIAIPAMIWAAIVALELGLFAVGVADDSIFHRSLRSTAFYLLPLLLYWIVCATFYSSYRILNRRGGLKSAIVFIFIQVLAYFVFVEANVAAPALSRPASLWWTAVIAGVVVGVIAFVTMAIKVPVDVGPSEGADATSVLMAGIFSLIIAAITYFRVQGDIKYISWGVMLGVLAGGMMVKSDKLALALLYFLDPRGASGLYHLLAAHDEVEDEKARGLRELEMGRLQDERRRTSALRLANELEQELNTVSFERGKTQIVGLIEGLRNVSDAEEGEQERRIAVARHTIDRLRALRDVPLLTDSSNLSSVGERVSAHVGLNEAELTEAIAAGLIDARQKHLWTIDAQQTLQVSMHDVAGERLRGRKPVLVAANLEKSIKATPILLTTLIELLTKPTSPPTLIPIRGAEEEGWLEARFATVSYEYSAVIRRGPAGDFVVLGIFRAGHHASG